jgi:hypothetical protein
MNHAITLVSRATILVALLASFCASQSRAQDRAESDRPVTIALTGVAVVDVVHGQLVGPRTVLIADGRIAAIGEPDATDVPTEAVRVDGSGRYLMPGLVDMHVHLFNNTSRRPPNDWAFPLFVANGVTAVREMRSEPAGISQIATWRAAVNRGELVAPYVLAAGMSVRGDSVDAARREVREAKSAGADFIKVFSDVPRTHWRAIIEQAHALALPVCGHIPAEVSLREAAAARQASNEHLTQVYEACSAPEKQSGAQPDGPDATNGSRVRDREDAVLQSFDQRVCDEAAAALARTVQVQVPTLVLADSEARAPRFGFSDDPRWRCLRADEQVRWERLLNERSPRMK